MLGKKNAQVILYNEDFFSVINKIIDKVKMETASSLPSKATSSSLWAASYLGGENLFSWECPGLVNLFSTGFSTHYLPSLSQSFH